MSLLINQSYASENSALWASASVQPVTSITAGAGIGVNQPKGDVSIVNMGVIELAAGPGVGISGPTGAVTMSNTGVLSLVAGPGITISGATGNVTVSNNAPSDMWPMATNLVITSTANTPQNIASRALGKSFNYAEGYGFLYSSSGTFASAPNIRMYLTVSGGAIDTAKSISYILQPSSGGITNLTGYYYDLSQIRYFDASGFTNLTLTWLTDTGGNQVTFNPVAQTSAITNNATTAVTTTKTSTTVQGAAGFKLFTT